MIWQEPNYSLLDLNAVKVFLDNLTSVTGLVTHVYSYKDELTLKRSLKTVLKGIELLANSLKKAEYEKKALGNLHLCCFTSQKLIWTGHPQSCFYQHWKASLTCSKDSTRLPRSHQHLLAFPIPLHTLPAICHVSSVYSSKILATGVSRQQVPTMYLNSSSHLTS